MKRPINGHLIRVESGLSWPAIITREGEKTAKRFLEFFTANIRNENRRFAVTLRLEANLVLQAASLEGLALLKIVSWGDRPQERRRDAQDLDWLMDEYLDITQDEQLFSEQAAHADLLDEDFDSLTAGARMMGRNIGNIASAATRQTLLAILAAENQRSGITVLANTAEQLRSRFASSEQALVRWRELLRGIRESDTA